MTDDAGSTIANDLHVKLDRSDMLLYCELSQRFEFVIWMTLTTNDCDVLSASDVRESSRDGNGIIMTAAGNEHTNRRVPRVIRIAIRGDILTTAARRINESDSSSCSSPNGDTPELDV